MRCERLAIMVTQSKSGRACFSTSGIPFAIVRPHHLPTGRIRRDIVDPPRSQNGRGGGHKGSWRIASRWADVGRAGIRR